MVKQEAVRNLFCKFPRIGDAMRDNDGDFVSTFRPASCTFELPKYELPEIKQLKTHIINISAEQMERALEAAIGSLVADWPRLAEARRQARNGEGRLLDDILVDGM
jgi:hypothetical protein